LKESRPSTAKVRVLDDFLGDDDGGNGGGGFTGATRDDAQLRMKCVAVKGAQSLNVVRQVDGRIGPPSLKTTQL
jgi:hypothetical protein